MQSLYEIKFKENIENKEICTQELDSTQILTFILAIEEFYFAEFYVGIFIIIKLI